MTTIDAAFSIRPTFILRFRPLSARGSGLSFPCTGSGSVDMDALEEGALRNYLYARAVVGVEFARPSVEPALI
jgi:hypothetical protein